MLNMELFRDSLPARTVSSRPNPRESDAASLVARLANDPSGIPSRGTEQPFPARAAGQLPEFHGSSSRETLLESATFSRGRARFSCGAAV